MVANVPVPHTRSRICVVADRTVYGERNMSKLEKRFEAEINTKNFNMFEWAGFRAQPRLALMAGMAIGYGIAMSDIEEKLEGIKNAIQD